MTKPMHPGPELDGIVCRAVGIPHESERDAGFWWDGTKPNMPITACEMPKWIPRIVPVFPKVSTAPSFEQYCAIMEWLREKQLWAIEPLGIEEKWWCVGIVISDIHEFVTGDTIAHAVCLAVAAVVEAEAKP